MLKIFSGWYVSKVNARHGIFYCIGWRVERADSSGSDGREVTICGAQFDSCRSVLNLIRGLAWLVCSRVSERKARSFLI